MTDSDPGRGTWLILETLRTGHSLVAFDGNTKQQSSLERAISGFFRGRGVGRLVSNWLVELLDRAASTVAPVDEERTLRDATRFRAMLHPLIGPENAMHGACVWVGPAAVAPTSRPAPCIPFVWDSTERTVKFGPRAAGYFDDAAGARGRTTITAPEAFRIVDVYDSLSLITTLLTPSPDAVWCGAATARVSGEASSGQLILAADATAGTVWRGLFHPGATSAPFPESLEAAALSVLPVVEPAKHIALMDVAKMRLIRWITDPIPGIQWKGLVDNRDTPHPDDVSRIAAACTAVFTGESNHGSIPNVRLRRIGGGWTIVDAAGALIRRDNAPLLALIQLTVVGTSDEPDPVPPWDTGIRGLDDTADS